MSYKFTREERHLEYLSSNWRLWRLIGRHEAEDKLRGFYESEETKLSPLGAKRFVHPDYERLRNYEMEWELSDVYGGEWCINSICPFDGVFCRLMDTPHGQELYLKCQAGWRAAGGSQHADNSSILRDFEGRGLISPWKYPRATVSS